MEETKAEDKWLQVEVGNSVDGAVYSLQLDLSRNSFEELQLAITKHSTIAAPDQILLYGPPFARLDPRKGLECLVDESHATTKQVFLYDRRMLSQAEPILPRATLDVEDVLPPEAPSLTSESLDALGSGNLHPLFRAVAEFESYFLKHYYESELLDRTVDAKLKACSKCTNQIRVQCEAIDAAIANLEMFQTSMSRHFRPFWDDFEQTSIKHESLLANFDSYLDTLAGIALHPALASDERKRLIDCIPVDREKDWQKQCATSHTHVKAQVEALRLLYEEIQSQIETILVSKQTISGDSLRTSEMLERMKQKALAQRQNVTSKLQKNFTFVVEKLRETSEQCVSTSSEPGGAGNAHSMLLQSTAALEVCRSVDELYRQQCDHLFPSVAAFDGEVQHFVSTLVHQKQTVASAVHAQMRRISVAQSRIRDFETSLSMLKEAHSVQKKHFGELEHLERLPQAYEACLKEVTRRLRYGRRFAERIESMAEELAHLREEEVHHREDFLREFGLHLPRDFVPGLAEKPSHCEFRMRPFDQNLPQIEDVHDPSSGPAISPERRTVDAREYAELQADLEVYRKRCEELESRVVEMSAELHNEKKGPVSSDSLESCGSISASKASGREEESSCEFPLVLALAAMTNSGETDARSNGGDKRALARVAAFNNSKSVASWQSNPTGGELGDLEAELRKLQLENQQHVLNAAAFEEEIQQLVGKKDSLEDKQSQLQQSIQSLRYSVGIQRSSLFKILELLGFDMKSDEMTLEEYLNAEMNDIVTKLQQLTSQAQSALVAGSEVVTTSLQDECFKISFQSFEVNDLALFLPTSANADGKRVYLAFHLGCPFHFLSEESIASFSNAGKRFPDFVLGRIVLIDEQVATDTFNPFALAQGQVFFILTVTSLEES